MKRRLAFVLIVAACNPATTRPAFGPYPEALRAIVNAPRARVVTEAQAWLAAQTPAPRVAQASVLDGYLETAWFDATDSAGAPLRTKVRLWADPDAAGRSRLTVEAVYRPIEDPSRSPRDLERPAPAGSAGRRFAERLWEELKKKLGETEY